MELLKIQTKNLLLWHVEIHCIHWPNNMKCLLMNRIGVLKRSYVVKIRRYIIVLIAIVAAVLTPPDIVSQIILAIPMWLLFEISILFMRQD